MDISRFTPGSIEFCFIDWFHFPFFVNPWMKNEHPQPFLFTQTDHELPFYPLSFQAEMQKPPFFIVSAKLPQHVIPPFRLLTLYKPQSLVTPRLLPCSRFRSTGWRWVGWAKHPLLCLTGQTVPSQWVRTAPQTLSAPSRPSPTCSRKSSSLQSRSRSSRRRGTTTWRSTSNWPTTPTNSKAHA